MTDLGRLRWRCRRGIKELDVLLTRYVDERLASAPVAEQQAFERLLEAQDPLIYAYCLGQAPVPADFESLVERITTASAGAASPAAGSGPRC